MYVQHNMSAIFTDNRLTVNSKRASKSAEKLSTGYKINRASDDAAGLQISEKMRTQIRGLNQAQSNIQDGISLLQTADGGLSNVHDCLHRIRELCVQAANGTLSDTDRAAIKKEIDEMASQIDSIANDTEFNTIKPLTLQAQESKIDVISDSPVYNEIADRIPNKTDMLFILDKTGSMGGVITYAKATMGSFTDKIGDLGKDVRYGLIAYGDVNIDTDPLVNYDFTTDADEFRNYYSSITASGGGDWEESGLDALMNALTDYSFRSDADLEKHVVLITDAPFHDPYYDEISGTNKSLNDIIDQLKVAGVVVDIIGPTSGEGYSQLSKIKDATGGMYYNINDVNVYSSSVTIPLTPLNLQVGANSGQRILVYPFDSRVVSLGISSLYIDPPDAAGESISKVDHAIDKVSNKRADFGATQNRLEHALSNAGNGELNLSDSEARIRDTDMASEMVEYAKHHILEQSSQAMLSQINKNTQSMIQLLQGGS